MLVRKLMLTAVACCVPLGLAAPGASATTLLRTDPGSSLLTGATTITTTSSTSSTLTFGGFGAVHCNQTTFIADVTSNSAASSITGQITAFTFSTCTDSLPVVTVSTCSLPPGTFPTVHAVANGTTGGSIRIDDLVIRCGIVGAPTQFCYYTTASATGNAVNATSVIGYPSAFATVTSGSGSLGNLCGSGTGTVFGTGTHIVQGGTNKTMTLTTV